MVKQSTTIGARLRKLEAAKARAAKHKSDAILSSRPMSELLGVTWNVLRDWCNELDGFEDAGCFTRGGNGIEWEFNPRRTVSFLIKHFKARLAGEERKSRAITKAVGVTLSPDEMAPSLAETKDLVNLTVTVTAAAEKQGQYVLAEDVVSFLSGYNQAVLDGILGVRTKVDPNGNLPPDVRKKVDDHLRSVATAVHAAAAKFIEANGAHLQQRGIG